MLGDTRTTKQILLRNRREDQERATPLPWSCRTERKAIEMAENIRSFLKSFADVKESSKGQYKCKCPAHKDRHASLSIKEDSETGKILLHCHAGCETTDVLSAVGKTMASIQPDVMAAEPAEPKGWQRNLEAEYRYTEADGTYLYSKLKYRKANGEKYCTFAIIEGDSYHGNRGGRKPVLYNLQALNQAIKAGRRIYIVEGEKDVETLQKQGMTAVTAGGAGDWKQEFADCFVGASEVVIIADNDKPGREVAKKISRDLRNVVFLNKVITPSDIEHGDVTDYLEKEGGSVKRLLGMIKKTDPAFAHWLDVGNKVTVNVDLLAAEILKRENVFIARNPGTKSDIVFWFENGVYRQMSDTEVAAKVRKWLPVGRATPDTINKVTKMILYSSETKSFQDINEDERYINLRDGLLDIHTGELKTHDPDLISTLQLGCRFVPGKTAPRWEAFIRDLCLDPETGDVDAEMRDVLQEWCGLILSSIYGYRTKKCLLLYSPRGNTGKSVFLSVIAGILGDEEIANVDFKAMGQSRWATGQAFSKRCLVIGDEGGERIESSQIFKQLTGGDIVEAELKGLQHFRYRFRGAIIAACNLLPYFADDKGDHIADRLHILRCRHTIKPEDRDPMLVDKLLLEKDGIFQWAWAGLQRFIKNGMCFSKCSSSEDAISEYRARIDTMYAFLTDEFEITNDTSDTIKKTELVTLYELYCMKNDLTALAKKNIPGRLAGMGVLMACRHGYDVFVGLKPKGCAELADDSVSGF